MTSGIQTKLVSSNSCGGRSTHVKNRTFVSVVCNVSLGLAAVVRGGYDAGSWFERYTTQKDPWSDVLLDLA